VEIYIHFIRPNQDDNKILMFTHNLKHGNTLYLYIHGLVVRAKQLASVAQLVGALHQNRKVTFFPAVAG
jgi:hypothetical protein